MASPGSTAERTCKVLRQPRGVEEARRFAELAVTYCDVACREATAMVVTELAENMIKYGGTHAGVFAGTISIVTSNGIIRITAGNEVASASDASSVKEAIGKISQADDVMTLYRSRLAELFTNPGLARAQLGLLRAAFEGGFRLSCSYEPPSLVIVAERSCILR
jgi:hypothetical protein